MFSGVEKGFIGNEWVKYKLDIESLLCTTKHVEKTSCNEVSTIWIWHWMRNHTKNQWQQNLFTKIILTHLFLVHLFTPPRNHQKLAKIFCFQGVEKGCIGKKWVNKTFMIRLTIFCSILVNDFYIPRRVSNWVNN